MSSQPNCGNPEMICERIAPVAIKDQKYGKNFHHLAVSENPETLFSAENCPRLLCKGAYVVLDFGKEVCGGLQLLTQNADSGSAALRITLGESLTEACSDIGYKNATNDHSPRDFTVQISDFSDAVFGQSGFRFARIMLQSEGAVQLRKVFAVNHLPVFHKEGHIVTDDAALNQIIDTAIYTLKLTFQDGYIWDGVKRDRLVWCGDLHPEIVSALYLFGDNDNIRNSLTYLRENTPKGKWVNGIPSYSAWWVINLCDYYALSGNAQYFAENEGYARELLSMLNACVSHDGVMDFSIAPNDMPFFLDWPTFGTEDAMIGTAALLIYAAKKYLSIQPFSDAQALVDKLQFYLEKPCCHKCIRAFQILAGRKDQQDAAFLEKGGAEGLSTFMAYYILKADALSGGQNMLSILKEYYGGMLQRGATTFWEDFDIAWLKNSGRIDEFPAEGKTDIHGDYGAFCYKGLRHSLCHGWSAGILAFLAEQILEKSPALGSTTVDASLFVEDKRLNITL